MEPFPIYTIEKISRYIRYSGLISDCLSPRGYFAKSKGINIIHMEVRDAERNS